MKEPKKIYAVGDVHGRADRIEPLLRRIWSESGLRRGEKAALIFAGDFGFVFWDTPEEREARKRIFGKWAEKFMLIAVPGNHENYDAILAFPKKREYGCDGYEEPGVPVFWPANGSVLSIGGVRIWTFGGGLSIDAAERRIAHELGQPKCWWPQEIDEASFGRGLKSAEEEGISYAVTHDVPDGAFGKIAEAMSLEGEKCPMQPFLERCGERLLKSDGFRRWYAGHYHPRAPLRVEEERLTVLPIEGYEELR